jgi:brefeldin A-inhibited guanine nucleotide-exchange protein
MLTTVFCYFHLQKEIEVLLNEIFLPILEMRTSTIKQKSVILNVFLRLSQDPQALVEIYLNYDCDRTAIENIYERLVEIIAKIGSTHFAGGKEGDVGAGGVGRNEGGRAGAADKGPVIPPSLTTSAMGGAGSSSDPLGGRREAWAHLSPEVKLRRQSLECLVTVLRSLVQWGTAGPRGSASTAAHMEGGAAVGMENGSSAEGRTGASSPTIGTEEDDPERFESAKQRKNALMEGIKKFNFKPKRVSRGFLLYPPHLHADCLATVCSSLVLGRVSNLSSKTGSSEAARQTTSPSSSLLPKA